MHIINVKLNISKVINSRVLQLQGNFSFVICEITNNFWGNCRPVLSKYFFYRSEMVIEYIKYEGSCVPTTPFVTVSDSMYIHAEVKEQA